MVLNDSEPAPDKGRGIYRAFLPIRDPSFSMFGVGLNCTISGMTAEQLRCFLQVNGLSAQEVEDELHLLESGEGETNPVVFTRALLETREFAKAEDLLLEEKVVEVEQEFYGRA